MKRLFLMLVLLLLCPSVVHAAVAFDAMSKVGAAGTGTLSWTHTPSGTPRAILVFIEQNVGGTDEVTAVTYGGTSMTECALSPELHTAADEDGAVYCYFLGASVPTGAQTVEVTVDGTGSTKSAHAISYTASGNVEMVNTVVQDSGAGNLSTDTTVNLALSGRTSAVAVVFFVGIASPANVTPMTGWTDQPCGGTTCEFDYGSQIGGSYTYDTVGTTDVGCGLSGTLGDNGTMLCVAISEIAQSQAPRSMHQYRLRRAQ